MARHPRLRTLLASMLQGIYLTALILALLAFGLRAEQSIAAVRTTDATPADALSALAAWFCGEESAQADVRPQKQ